MSYSSIIGKIPSNWKEKRTFLPRRPNPPRCKATRPAEGSQRLGVTTLSLRERACPKLSPCRSTQRGNSRGEVGRLTPERLVLALVGSVQQHYFNPVHVEQRARGQHACQACDCAQEDVEEHRWGQGRAAMRRAVTDPEHPPSTPTHTAPARHLCQR